MDGKVDYDGDAILFAFENPETTQIEIINNLRELNEADLLKIGKGKIKEVKANEIETFIKQVLGDYLKEMVKKKDLHVPNGLKEFYEKQHMKWIESAMQAVAFQENIHYIIKDNQIMPVDYFSTGIIQSSTSWCDGLHQFLQLKHNLKLTSETFTTNFLSNVGYFKNNYSCLYGLTGTLGSAKTREVLEGVYNVGVVEIPQLRAKQYVELPSLIVFDEVIIAILDFFVMSCLILF